MDAHTEQKRGKQSRCATYGWVFVCGQDTTVSRRVDKASRGDCSCLSQVIALRIAGKNNFVAYHKVRISLTSIYVLQTYS